MSRWRGWLADWDEVMTWTRNWTEVWMKASHVEKQMATILRDDIVTTERHSRSWSSNQQHIEARWRRSLFSKHESQFPRHMVSSSSISNDRQNGPNASVYQERPLRFGEHWLVNYQRLHATMMIFSFEPTHKRTPPINAITARWRYILAASPTIPSGDVRGRW